MSKTYQTNYGVAVHWCHNSLVLCNNIEHIDPSIWDNMMPVIEIGKDDEPVCPECGEEINIHPYIDEDGDETDNYECKQCGNIWDPDDYPCVETASESEIFQWFITDCSEWDVNFLREHFGLLFTYSNMLECYVLCVTHYGTSWDYVDWVTDLENAECKLGEKK